LEALKIISCFWIKGLILHFWNTLVSNATRNYIYNGITEIAINKLDSQTEMSARETFQFVKERKVEKKTME